MAIHTVSPVPAAGITTGYYVDFATVSDCVPKVLFDPPTHLVAW